MITFGPKRNHWETMHDSKWDFGDQSYSIVPWLGYGVIPREAVSVSDLYHPGLHNFPS